MTPDELKGSGFIQDPDSGEWFAPGHYRVMRANTVRERAACQLGNTGAPPKLERDPGDGAVVALQVQGKIGGRFLVRVKSYRRRLLDEDNLCCKYIVDLCRYAGMLPSDAPGRAKIEVSQEKVGAEEQEFVRVEIFKAV